jgi:hypothetical protein
MTITHERLYEFHITAYESSIQELSKNDIPIIGIEALAPSGYAVQLDWMTSYTDFFYSQESAINYIGVLLKKINFTPIYRVKVETPYDNSLIMEEFKYIETHLNSLDNNLPKSRNIITNKIISTDRTYNFKEFHSFAERYNTSKVELCVMDTNIYHDHNWFMFYDSIPKFGGTLPPINLKKL